MRHGSLRTIRLNEYDALNTAFKGVNHRRAVGLVVHQFCKSFRQFLRLPSKGVSRLHESHPPPGLVGKLAFRTNSSPHLTDHVIGRIGVFKRHVPAKNDFIELIRQSRPVLKPVLFENLPFIRRRALLIENSRPDGRTLLFLNILQRLQIVPFGEQGFALFAEILVIFGDGWEIDDLPFTSHAQFFGVKQTYEKYVSCQDFFIELDLERMPDKDNDYHGRLEDV
ncbi:MAG: hypothetical protein LBR53_01025 [Deltaproteobacteria bacterium]|nr:hypothetical protein [Deltaproteobacteria bacterium]